MSVVETEHEPATGSASDDRPPVEALTIEEVDLELDEYLARHLMAALTLLAAAIWTVALVVLRQVNPKGWASLASAAGMFLGAPALFVVGLFAVRLLTLTLHVSAPAWSARGAWLAARVGWRRSAARDRIDALLSRRRELESIAAGFADDRM